jgi:hypothetical protein
MMFSYRFDTYRLPQGGRFWAPRRGGNNDGVKIANYSPAACLNACFSVLGWGKVFLTP